MKRTIKKLTDQEINFLENRFGSFRFPASVDLVYENQIPNTGLLLLSGEAVFTRNKRIIDSMEPGSLYGIYELLNNEPVKHGCKIRENAKVILLQKSDLIDLTREDSPISKILA